MGGVEVVFPESLSGVKGHFGPINCVAFHSEGKRTDHFLFAGLVSALLNCVIAKL
uniref:Uncharacterized protein n=1 Tax=Cynoglossus semilaevis TaxID=244447 RepID=A0A3P8VGU9_CYNSE